MRNDLRLGVLLLVRYIDSGNSTASITKKDFVGYITLVVDGRASQSMLLSGRLEIGREKNNDIVVSDQKVSRNHTTIISHDDETVIAIDRNSSNGTYVNGLLINQPTNLQDNDKIRVGDTTFLFTKIKPSTNSLILVTEPIASGMNSEIATTEALSTNSTIFNMKTNITDVKAIRVVLGCVVFMIILLVIILAFLLGVQFAVR